MKGDTYSFILKRLKTHLTEFINYFPCKSVVSQVILNGYDFFRAAGTKKTQIELGIKAYLFSNTKGLIGRENSKYM